MKVNKTSALSRTQSINRIDNAKPVNATNFSALMDNRQEEQTRQELEQLMKDIKHEGERLVDERNIDVLVGYKKKVRSFVSKAVDFAFDIQDRKGLSRFGRGKILKIIAQIDDDLVALTDQFLAEERNRIKLLEKIGELQGLLYNIYA